MATHMMEKDNRQKGQLAQLAEQNTFRVSSFVAHLIAGLFSEKLDFSESTHKLAFAQGMIDYLNYDWPILNSKKQIPIEASVEQTLTCILHGLVSGSPKCAHFIEKLTQLNNSQKGDSQIDRSETSQGKTSKRERSKSPLHIDGFERLGPYYFIK